MNRYSISKVSADIDKICEEHDFDRIRFKKLDRVLNKKKKPVYLVTVVYDYADPSTTISTLNRFRQMLAEKNIDALIIPVGPEDAKHGVLGVHVSKLTKGN